MTRRCAQCGRFRWISHARTTATEYGEVAFTNGPSVCSHEGNGASASSTWLADYRAKVTP